MAERRAVYRRGWSLADRWVVTLAFTVILTVFSVEYLVVRGPIARTIRGLETGRYGRAVEEAQVASVRAFEPLMKAYVGRYVREARCLSEWDSELERARSLPPLQCLSMLKMACMDLPKWPRGAGLQAKAFDLAIERARELCTFGGFDMGTEFIRVAEAFAFSPEQSGRHGETVRAFRDFERRHFPVQGLDHSALWTRAAPEEARLQLECPDGLGPFALEAGPEMALAGGGTKIQLTGLLMDAQEAARAERLQIGGHDFSGDAVPELVLAARVEETWVLAILWLDRRAGTWQTALHYRWRGKAFAKGQVIQFNWVDGPVSEFQWIRGLFVAIPHS